MPANSSGWFWHSLARETGRLGHLFSPGGQRGPWPWFPYAMDNGCFSLWEPVANTFDEDEWRSNGVEGWRRLVFWAQAAPQKPMWAIVPDRPGSWEETRIKWFIYAQELREAGIPLAVAVQNGATHQAVADLFPRPEVVCVGGTYEWKWETAAGWIANFPRVHVLKCNAPEKLAWLASLGCESTDGTGWNRGDRTQTAGLEMYCRERAVPTSELLWPHASRAKCRKQMAFA